MQALTDEQQRDIVQAHQLGTEQRTLAAQYGVSRATISRVVSRAERRAVDSLQAQTVGPKAIDPQTGVSFEVADEDILRSLARSVLGTRLSADRQHLGARQHRSDNRAAGADSAQDRTAQGRAVSGQTVRRRSIAGRVARPCNIRHGEQFLTAWAGLELARDMTKTARVSILTPSHTSRL